MNRIKLVLILIIISTNIYALNGKYILNQTLSNEIDLVDGSYVETIYEDIYSLIIFSIDFISEDEAVVDMLKYSYYIKPPFREIRNATYKIFRWGKHEKMTLTIEGFGDIHFMLLEINENEYEYSFCVGFDEDQTGLVPVYGAMKYFVICYGKMIKATP